MRILVWNFVMQVAKDLPEAARRPTNVSLNVALVAEAKRLGLNISRACEDGLSQQIASERARQWKADNADSIASWNAWVEAGGLPLARHRQF
jgi:antitoxin CcdA